MTQDRIQRSVSVLRTCWLPWLYSAWVLMMVLIRPESSGRRIASSVLGLRRKRGRRRKRRRRRKGRSRGRKRRRGGGFMMSSPSINILGWPGMGSDIGVWALSTPQGAQTFGVRTPNRGKCSGSEWGLMKSHFYGQPDELEGY